MDAPPYTASIERVTRVELGASWHKGCPVAPARLRLVRVKHVGFDGRVHDGAIVVNRRVAADVVSVFRRLYAARFPIRRMVPVTRYGADDERSMAADNTSGFNCRPVSGTSRWSMHAYGEAIDVNTVENPEVGTKVSPPAGRRYRDRTNVRPGMAVAGGVLVKAFAAAGWSWGGRWNIPDYQHFSTTGR